MRTWSGGGDISQTEGVGECGTYCTESSDCCWSLWDWMMAATGS